MRMQKTRIIWVATLITCFSLPDLGAGQNDPGIKQRQSNTSQAQLPKNQRQLADKLSSHQMTQGLSNRRADGTVWLNFEGGVSGYAGPMRDTGSIGTDMTSPEQAKINAENTKRQAAIERERALTERAAQARRAQREAQANMRATEQQRADLARFCESKRMSVDYKSMSCVSDGGTNRRRTSVTRSGVPQQENPRDLYGGQNSPGDLISACGAKGFTADFVTGNCISPQGRQSNPHNLYPPFVAPLPKPQPNELIMRCGAMGRAADFATGRCM